MTAQMVRIFCEQREDADSDTHGLRITITGLLDCHVEPIASAIGDLVKIALAQTGKVVDISDTEMLKTLN